MIRGLVFDIDDTLYLERDYVRSGFEHVGRVVGRTDEERARVTGRLWSGFEAGVRGDAFDRVLADEPEIAARTTARAMVEAYRTHRPAIALAPDVASLLDVLSGRGLRLGVLSDGPPESQQAKADALDLARWFDPIVLTGGLGPDFAKPGTAGFARIASEWGMAPAELGYVADNPAKDFIGPRRLGWWTVRVRRPLQLHHDAEGVGDARPDAVIATLAGLVGSL